MINFGHARSGFMVRNISATAAAILSLSLLSILFYILIKGLSYFAFFPTVEVHWQQPNVSSNVEFAQQFPSDSDATKITLLLHNQQTLRNQQVNIDSNKVQIHLPAEPIWTLYLSNGNLIFGQYLSVSMAQDNTLTTQPYSSTTIAQCKQAIEQLQQQRRLAINQIAPLQVKFAALAQNNRATGRVTDETLVSQIDALQITIQQIDQQLSQFTLNFVLANGQKDSVPIHHVDYMLNTNALSWVDRVAFGSLKIWQFLSHAPSQDNSTGGVFPALFGTLLLVFLMTIVVMPLGILTALYLHEYAENTVLTVILRTIITNLAGIPSIVYGVFGLGLFVFVMGTSIDQWIYTDRLPAPTFGSPGLLWAALTMALLTLPVVIVATEEGLRQVPDGLKKGAMALGATRYEMIRDVVLPIASPSIVTGGILAIARAAGEVAPLLLVGAVMYAPSLPVDSTFPYIHLERQFMHLGVLVFDGVFHSQHSLNASSMMFATCLLLILIVLVLNSLASWLRFKLKKQTDWQAH